MHLKRTFSDLPANAAFGGFDEELDFAVSGFALRFIGGLGLTIEISKGMQSEGSILSRKDT